MLITNANIATVTTDGGYGLIPGGTVAVTGDRIEWAGPAGQMPGHLSGDDIYDAGGRLLTPGLIDCHTHIVFGGNRAAEFEQRLTGVSYEEISRSGGGIVSTVRATRDADAASLLRDALSRVDALIAEGVTTLEIKSGYGLDPDTELKMLRTARAVGKHRPVTVCTTFLGAHAVPDDLKGQPDRYIDDVCIPALRAAAAEGLVDAVDGFCESIAFSPDQIRRVFDAAAALGLPVKLHAEQLSHLGGTRLAADYGAMSADHLEYADENDARAMAASGTTAVLLPGAFYTLREDRLPPVDAFRAHGVPMALATDCNPGSSPLTSLLMAMNMGCTLFRLTPAEALAGVTRNAAGALGLTDRGYIAPGARADLCLWDAGHPAELSYRIGYNPLYKRFFGGRA